VDAACVNFMCQSGPNVPDDSGCGEDVLANECGSYPPVFCNGLEKQKVPGCANACLSDDDCAPDSHCDQVCVPDLADGMSCNEDSDCVSDHCDGELCCAGGTCCDDTGDCEAFFLPAVCDSPETCQGTRVDGVCDQFVCASTPPIDDDSGCGAALPASGCGSFVDLHCNGDLTQAAPLCPESCSQAGDCDEGHTCKEQMCVAEAGAGHPCESDTECLSKHCQNGFCCTFGDCCGEEQDCPPQYAVAPQCKNQETCQGFRMDPTCEQHMCGSAGPIEDDSGCGVELLAQTCAPYPDRYCTGTPAQLPPTCASDCQEDADCVEQAHCDDLVCTEDLPDGYSCDEPGDCVSGHCTNQVCCQAGDCCLEGTGCPAKYRTLPTCEVPDQCQGFRIDALCESFQCSSSDVIEDDSGCTSEVVAADCGFFLPLVCVGETDQAAPQCPAACLADEECLAGHHCDDVCLPDEWTGTVCDEDSDCQTGHCANGFCCSKGSCCIVADDCPPEFIEEPACVDQTACQGHRVDPVCLDFVCGTEVVEDDSACTPEVVVDECGDYLAVACTGEVQQTAPSCAQGCDGDELCDAAAHCDEVCMPDLGAGIACDEHTDCETGHCQNGFCCSGEDCCAQAADCPDLYRQPAVCDHAPGCQGHRVDAVCAESVCQSVEVEDDTACDDLTLADDCGPNPDVFCDGAPAQAAPECSPACLEDGECGPGYHCDAVCTADVPHGLSCDEDSDCQSGHCQNEFCCDAGDCCQFDYHCPESYQEDPECASPATCQGHRRMRKCLNFICLSQKTDDDSACTAQQLAQDCGLYLDLNCNGQKYQAPPLCPASCQWDSECQASAHCDATCQEDLPNGSSCDENSDCLSGLCANGFCTSQGMGCVEPADCPAQFSSAAKCHDAATCQGTRVDPTCVDNQCGSQVVDDDSDCTAAVTANLCDWYEDLLCTGEAEQVPPQCPQSCVEDEECDPGAHCDGSCVQDVEDGAQCDEDSDCTSEHCAEGLCCDEGDCCLEGADCPALYSAAPACNAAVTCQGVRVDAQCKDFVCSSLVVDDDTACTAETEADDCGAFLSVFCTGAADQTAPDCKQSCSSDVDCDPKAHCDGICLGDLADGSHCNEDSDCASGHCEHGLCCQEGDCCLAAASCPGQYKSYPECDDDSTCTGHRVDPTCVDYMCGSLEVEDDSGCGWWTVADDCGPFVEVSCSGAVDQETPLCPVTCVADDECDSAAHCDGTCLWDLAAGKACDEDSDCQSEHCQNGFCCATGDCCSLAADCPAQYTQAAQCLEEDTCQGERLEPACQAHACVSVPAPDDSACTAGTQTLDCAPYGPVFCTGEATQEAPQCPAGCLADGQCSNDGHCDDGVCEYDLEDGIACDEDSDCQSEHCQNGFCCAGSDCCYIPFDCPASYAGEPVCNEPGACQGTRDDVACADHMCATEVVDDDSACTQATESDLCGLYKSVFCNGSLDQEDPPCQDSCAYDSQCDPAAHCDDVCLADLADGEACDENSDCQSAHCQNGFCCESGDCCHSPEDCPDHYEDPAICSSTETCQGERGDRVCIASKCDTQSVDDDSGCVVTTMALSCGYYQDLYCTGQAVQEHPECPTQCEEDSDCTSDGHCDGTCLADLADGDGCDEDSDCQFDHCQNDFCCTAGDCCQLAADCPPEYTADSVCGDAGTCQGFREEAACNGSVCAGEAVGDDSDCDGQTLADTCGFYVDIYCTGLASQDAPECPTSCAGDPDCDGDAHCDEVCLVDLANGQACDENSDCISTFCVDGYCCSSECPDPGEACDVPGKEGQCWPAT